MKYPLSEKYNTPELMGKIMGPNPVKLEEELLTDGSYPRTDYTDEMLSYIDILVDGRFIQELKDISLQFRGSRNQRIIDMNRTREVGEIVIWEKMRR